jgi:serine/threonine-protein kinase
MTQPPTQPGTPLSDNLTGRTLGHFEILDEIGRGGMATVYRARQITMNRIVAIKVLPRALMHDPSFYERFRREVDVIAHLEHPHIVPIFDYGEADGIPFIAMRYLAGGSLAQRIRRGLPDLETLIKPIRQVGQALDYAHQQGIIHRDLKPGNILLDEQDNAYLTDFGIARVVNSSLTGSAIIGTPAYMSPEQANGLPLDARSDVYTLGVVLFELLTGREPFEAETPVALLLKHINEPMPSPRSFRAGIPGAVERVIFRATAKHPDDRYPSAGELAEAFALAVTQPATAVLEAPVHDDQPTLIEASAQRATPIPTRAKATSQPGPRAATRPIETDGRTVTAVPEPAAQSRPVRRGAVMLGALAVVALLALAAVALIPRLAPPAPPIPTALPTPFARAVRVSTEQYSLSVPQAWQFADRSGERPGAALAHVWRSEDEAFIALTLIETGARTLDQVTREYLEAYYAGRAALSLIDTAAAPDGTLRYSYRFEDDGLPYGQVDLFASQRGAYTVILELYAADSRGDDLVPVFQHVLDSVRIS